MTTIKDLLDWLPDPVVALLILAIAVLACARTAQLGAQAAAPRAGRALSLRLFDLHPDARADPARAAHPGDDRRHSGRAASIPKPPLVLARLLVVAVIGLIGWAAITALHIAADLYLRRFRLDVDDNLLARKHNTQMRVLLRSVDVLLIMLTLGAALMTFEPVRQYGVSLFASAGVAGIVAGLAARPVLSNLMAGVQLAMTQPIRLDDAVIVENEYGTIEEITSTYVVVRLWDLRRMIVPLSLFHREAVPELDARSSALIGNVHDLSSITARRSASSARKLDEIVKESNKWDRKVSPACRSPISRKAPWSCAA